MLKAEKLRRLKSGNYRPDGNLWPGFYGVDQLESLQAFLADKVWTWNEAAGASQQIPMLPHIEFASRRWYETRATGTPLIIEKSRRLVMSWLITGCEVWSMGLRREDGIIAGLNYKKAGEHVWRVWSIYEEIRKRNPDWQLRQHEHYGSLPDYCLESVIFPNGSRAAHLNQEGQSFQGSGYKRVRMEEFSLYKKPAYMYGQAWLVCQNSAGQTPGHVVVVTNASPNIDWQETKAC